MSTPTPAYGGPLMLYDVSTIHPNSSGACEAIQFELVRQQLEQRAEQLGAAHAALEDRARSLEFNGPALPRPLRQQIAHFAAQLDEVRDELASLAGALKTNRDQAS